MKEYSKNFINKQTQPCALHSNEIKTLLYSNRLSNQKFKTPEILTNRNIDRKTFDNVQKRKSILQNTNFANSGAVKVNPPTAIHPITQQLSIGKDQKNIDSRGSFQRQKVHPPVLPFKFAPQVECLKPNLKEWTIPRGWKWFSGTPPYQGCGLCG